MHNERPKTKKKPLSGARKIAVGVLLLFLVVVVLADFLAPYDHTAQSRQATSAPPSTIRFRGQNGALQVQANVDGWQIFEQSQQTQDPKGGWAQVKMHGGQIGGVPFQRVLRPAQDGSTTITGQIGGLQETGRIVTDPTGQTHVTRDIGPYHLEQDIWFVAGQPQQPGGWQQRGGWR